MMKTEISLEGLFASLGLEPPEEFAVRAAEHNIKDLRIYRQGHPHRYHPILEDVSRRTGRTTRQLVTFLHALLTDDSWETAEITAHTLAYGKSLKRQVLKWIEQLGLDPKDYAKRITITHHERYRGPLPARSKGSPHFMNHWDGD